MSSSMSDETHFLEQLAQVESLAKEQPVMDGAALVVQISNQKLVCELVVEVRLPSTQLPGSLSPSDHKLLWVYLQNISDEPLKLPTPKSTLTERLKLLWYVDLQYLINQNLQIGKVLSWQAPITGKETPELLASEVVGILNTCKTIIDEYRSSDQ